VKEFSSKLLFDISKASRIIRIGVHLPLLSKPLSKVTSIYQFGGGSQNVKATLVCLNNESGSIVKNGDIKNMKISPFALSCYCLLNNYSTVAR
jgi:hypothetical protein